MNPIPTPGRIVLATVRDAAGQLVTRPALIVRVSGDAPQSAKVNAHVFLDDADLDGASAPAPAGPGERTGTLVVNPVFKRFLVFTREAGVTDHSWSWPAREAAPATPPAPVPAA